MPGRIWVEETYTYIMEDCPRSTLGKWLANVVELTGVYVDRYNTWDKIMSCSGVICDSWTHSKYYITWGNNYGGGYIYGVPL